MTEQNSTPDHTEGLTRIRVYCRPGLANGNLDGSTGYIIGRDTHDGEVRVWLMSGKHAGHCWSFGEEDVTPEPAGCA